MRRKDITKKFLLSNRKIDPVKGCWLWTKGKHAGYGIITTSRLEDHKVLTVHRISYELFIRPIPNGKDILHSCDVRACFKPGHLRPGTQVDNNKDRDKRNRTCRGIRHPFHKLSPHQVRTIRRSKKSQSCLSQQFGVAPSIIWRILHNISYADIK